MAVLAQGTLQSRQQPAQTPQGPDAHMAASGPVSAGLWLHPSRHTVICVPHHPEVQHATASLLASVSKRRVGVSGERRASSMTEEVH